MDYSVFRFTLNMHYHRSQASVSAFCGDTAIRLCITLSDGGIPYLIADGCVAILSGKKPDGTTLWNRCAIENNKIIYDFTKATTSCVGVANCEITLYGPDGGVITAPKFIIVVDEREVSGDDVNISESEQTAIDVVMEAAALIKSGALKIDSELSSTSEKAVQNKVITGALLSLEKRLETLEKNVHELARLATPVVSVSETGEISWNKIDNADGYIYRIYFTDGTHKDYSIDSPDKTTANVRLQNGQSVAVMADVTNENSNYSDSDWSEIVTYRRRLSTPEVTLESNGLLSWKAIENAEKYIYQVFRSSDEKFIGEYPTTNLTILLSSGMTVRVKAVDDDKIYNDSEYSESVTYIAEPKEIPLVYYGVGTIEDEEITSDFITGLTSKEQTSRVCSFTVSPSNQYIYFAAPKSYCVDGSGNYAISFSQYGLPATFRGPWEVTIGDTKYCVYRSKNILNCTITIDVN